MFQPPLTCIVFFLVLFSVASCDKQSFSAGIRPYHQRRIPMTSRNIFSILLTLAMITVTTVTINSVDRKEPNLVTSDRIEIINKGNPMDVFVTWDGGYWMLLPHFETMPDRITRIRKPSVDASTGGGIQPIRKTDLAKSVLRRIPAFSDEWREIMKACGVKFPPEN